MTSVIVVTNTLEAKAGSIFNFFKETGTKIPNRPATIMFKIIDMPIKRDNIISWNHICTITAVIIANIIPFKIPIKNSFPTIVLKFPEDNSFVAIALMVTANVYMPAFPPIDATIGIRNAKATICSIDAPNLLITHVANKAVNKLILFIHFFYV